uniref:Uncharacterized protein n=1 Tax=Cacopsylla melanoneura TaxID=428564 RepID=A0A8D8Z664_9HEMI
MDFDVLHPGKARTVPFLSLCLAKSGASITTLPNQPYFYIIHSQYFLVNPAVNHKNDVLILLAGTNDFLKSVNVNAIKQAHKKLVKYCTKRFKHVLLCQIPPIPKLSIEANENIKLFNMWLLNVYSQNPYLRHHNPFLLSLHLRPSITSLSSGQIL